MIKVLDCGSATTQVCHGGKSCAQPLCPLEACCHCYSMSAGGLYPAPAPLERIPSTFLNQVATDPVTNNNSYVCLVPFFNRLVQTSGLIQSSSMLPGNGYIQNCLASNYTPVLMDSGTAQTPPTVRTNNMNKKRCPHFLFVKFFIYFGGSDKFNWYMRQHGIWFRLHRYNIPTKCILICTPIWMLGCFIH